MEDILNPTIRNESLHENSNDNGVIIVNFATSKNLVSKAKCSHNAVFINSWKSPDGKFHNPIDHIVIDRRRHSNIFGAHLNKINESRKETTGKTRT
jgi:hypothetical protein